MPPTPELHVTVLEDKLWAWCADQGITMPAVRIHRRRVVEGNGVVHGTYSLDVIDLYVGSNSLATASGQRLLHVTRLLNETFLHELRHHWQHKSWSAEKLQRAFEGPYWNQTGEKDARDFAEAYKTSLLFLRVKRSYGGGTLSGFGRLGAAEKGART